jgi:hypothetical protein
MTFSAVQAKVFGQARNNVRTKYGERSVVDVTLPDGTTKAIWRGADDQSIARLVDGERVTLTIDGKGNVQKIEGSYERAEAQRSAAAQIAPVITAPKVTQPMGFQVEAPFEAERRLRAQIAAAKGQPVAIPQDGYSRIEPVPMAESGSGIDGKIAELAAIYGRCLAAAGDSEAVALKIFEVVIHG